MPYYRRRGGYGRGGGLAYSLMRAQTKARRIRRARANAALGRRVKAAARRAGLGPGEWGVQTYPAGTHLASAGERWGSATEAQRAYRAANGIVGRGKYSFAKFRRQAAGIGRTIGDMAPGAARIAELTGNPEAAAMITTGGEIGNVIGGRGMYVAGRGSYAPSTEGNVTIVGSGGSVPDFQSAGDETGAMVVSHSEFVGDVYGNSFTDSEPDFTFLNVNFELNPGLSRSFPFLSQVAVNFEEYEFIQLVYTYTPKISPNLSSTDGQVGSILMYTDYNAGDTPKRSKQAILQAYGSSNGRVIDSVLHGVECDPKKAVGDGHKFVRTRPLSGGDKEDLKDYDHGLFQLAICATPEALSNAVIGELHVSYRCLLRKPRTFSLYGLNIDQDAHWVDALSGGARFYRTGSMNSIGTKLDIGTVVGPNPQPATITFPASFAGDVSIEFQVSSMAGSAVSFAVEAPTLAGEVTPLLSMENIQAAKQLQWAVQTNSGTTATTTPLDSSNFMMGKITVHVEMAVSGRDNTVTWNLPVFNNDAWDMMIYVKRMNSMELDEPDQLLP